MRQATMERPHPAGMGGTQRIYRFGNGYGASVVQFPYSYGSDRGLWELAVTKYEGEDNDSYSLTYDTEITDDVIGYLEESEVDELLARIEALPANNVLRAGHARLACEVSDAVGSLAAGARRSDSGGGIEPPLSAVGISGLQAGEDVNSST